MKKFLPILCLLAVSVQADWKDGQYPDTITISSLPYLCGADNTVYLLSGNLTSNNRGITLSGRHYVKIDGRGDTVTFDTDGSGGVAGLTISGNSTYIVVKDLTITQAVTSGSYGSPGGDDATGILLLQAEWVYLRDCNAHVGGHSSRCLDGGSGAKQAIEVNGGNYTSFVRSFDSRHSADAAAFKLSSPKADPDTFHFYVHGVTIDSACHAGVLVGGIAWVDSNKVTIDCYNNKPGVSWANAHAIADAGYAWAGSRFNHNVIRTGANHYGGRGMYFNFSAGTEEEPVEMAYNDIRVTQGYTTESDAARGLRVRWGCFHLWVHHNYIEVTCDDDPATQHIGSEAHGIWFGAIGGEGSALGGHNWFYNNEIHATYNGDPGNAPGMATCFIADQIRDPDLPFGNGNKSFNNHFYSNLRCLQMSEDSHQGNEWLSVGDTLEWEDPQYTCHWGFAGAVGVGAGPALAIDNQLINPVFINCSSDNITNRSGGGTKSIYVRRTAEIVVTGNDGLTVPSATVRIWNRYGDSNDSGTAVCDKATNSRGKVYDTLAYVYHHWEGRSHSDSTYNDFVVRVEKDGKTAETTLVVGDVAPGDVGSLVIPLQLDVAGQETSNVAPTAPSLNSPPDGGDISDLIPTLVVNNGYDADGDALTYRFELYDSTGTILLESQSGIIEGVATTFWTVPSELEPNATYLWRARCYDGVEYSPWMSTAQFTVVALADNQPPSPPTLHSPAQGSAVNDALPTLSVINGSDPDGDALTYTFELYDSAGASLMASADDVPEGFSYTTWPVPIELDDKATYNWRARCYDGIEYSPWMSTAQFHVDLSSSLTLPVHASPLDGEMLIGGPVVLTVINSAHPDELQVTYDFFVYSNSSLTELVEEQTDVPETPDQTSAWFSFEPVHEQTYWWRVRAADGTRTTDLTPATSFTYSTFSLGDETVSQAVLPADGGVVHVKRPVLSALNVSVAGGHDYYFQVAGDPDFVDIVESSGPISSGPGDTTSWQLNSPLESGRTYHWRVRADDYAYSDAFSFTVVPKIIACPNPVHFLRGETITFQLPDKSVDLLIQTVAGETVLIKQNLSGSWEWDGRNASGHTVAIGTYSWFIGSLGQSGKIVVLP